MKLLLVFFLSIIAITCSAQYVRDEVYFDFNKYELNERAKKNLNEVATQVNYIDSINLYGYCDTVGINAYNDNLSMQRVKTVKAYLITHGLSASLFKEEKGYGKRRAMSDTDLAGDRYMNRMVEVWYYVHETEKADLKPAPVWEEQREKVIVPKRWDTFMDEIKIGQTFTLKNLNFYGGRHRLMPASEQVLDSLVSLLNARPTVEIEIQGYVCCMPPGTDALDHDSNTQTLSVNRAKAVYEYLVAHGIDKNRLSYNGYGSKPIVPDTIEENKETNRRVEIKVLKK